MDRQDPNTLRSGISRSVEASDTGHLIKGDIGISLGLLPRSAQCHRIQKTKTLISTGNHAGLFGPQLGLVFQGTKRVEHDHSQNPPKVFL
jgi:hypothetical protein